MWNLIPNSAIAVMDTLKKRAFKFFPKLGSTVKRTLDIRTGSNQPYTVYTFGATG